MEPRLCKKFFLVGDKEGSRFGGSMYVNNEQRIKKKEKKIVT